jgi:hypothetical protein
MPELADIIARDVTANTPTSAAQGTIAKTVASATDGVYVLVPAFDGSRQQWGPCDWAPRTADGLPKRGDTCLVVFDERETPFVICTRTFAGQGEQGVPGPPGPTGPLGPTGPQGPLGPQGPQGVQGVKGDTGATGATGPTGATGSTGAQGVKGDTGSTGAQGPTGAEGPQGPDGAPGGGTTQSDWTWQTAPTSGPFAQAGRIGVDTDTPATATQVWLHRLDNNSTDWGATIGALVVGDHVYIQQRNLATAWIRYHVTGAPTLNATTWVVPVAVDTGVQGTEPSSGTAALVAFQYTPPQGPKGDTGAQGPIGATGPQGPTGATGAQGVPGTTGPAGPQGPQGVAGVLAVYEQAGEPVGAPVGAVWIDTDDVPPVAVGPAAPVTYRDLSGSAAP